MTAGVGAALFVGLVFAAARSAVAATRRDSARGRFATDAGQRSQSRLRVAIDHTLIRHRQARLVEASLPVALESMARTLRTGGSLRQAIAEAAVAVPPPLGDDLSVVASRIEHGAPVADALDAWACNQTAVGVTLAGAALALGAETGGAQAKAIDGVAATIRERRAAAAEMRAQATQARLSALVIALSPVIFCALASFTDPKTAAFLFRTPAGLLLLAIGAGMDALGAFWMSRITRVGA